MNTLYLTFGGTNQVWKIIWKSTLAERDKVFLWRLLWNGLPTGDQLIRRGIGVSNTCVLCCSSHETREHLFRDCTITKRVWKASPLGLQIADHNKNQNLMEWIGNFLIYFNKHSTEKDYSIVVFTSTMKAVWNMRNLNIFQGAKIDPRVIMFDIEAEIRNWKKRKRGNSNTFKPTTNHHQDENGSTGIGTLHQQPTRLLQVDGSWKQHRKTGQIRAATGWVVVDEEKQILKQGGSQVFAKDPLQTEALAMLQGIQEVNDISNAITVYTDSSLLIQYLKNPASSPVHVRSIILDILELLNSFVAYACNKVPRSEVQLAHTQATNARVSAIM